DRRAERAGATQQVAQCLGLGAYVRQVLRRDPFVLAGGPGEVPTVHDQVEVEEPVDRLLERAATGDSVELYGGLRRILQVVQDDGASHVPRAGRVVGHVRGDDLFPADQLPLHGLRLDHVSDKLPARTAVAGSRVVQTVGWHGGDQNGEPAGQS